ncbi:hypothetical protein A0128_20135 [Leptospira tipperaryensis]|uniref:Uncharacterized protein n=1 Tax=Leptospira tipperaryensis TaxID=2564040 RepID=A0A1D7V3B6_9LEPT|nr:hypothetical protein [Leptospira tipperaryensis]AOP36330.1 hypothetical protein A0128_20135 [Leptospira tipperaryensis]
MNTKIPIKPILLLSLFIFVCVGFAIGLSEHRYGNRERILKSEIRESISKNEDKILKDSLVLKEKLETKKSFSLDQLPGIRSLATDLKNSNRLRVSEISGEGEYSIVIHFQEKYYLLVINYGLNSFFYDNKNKVESFKIDVYNPDLDELLIFQKTMKDEEIGFFERGAKVLFGFTQTSVDNRLATFVKLYQDDTIEILFYYQTLKLN